MAAIHHHNTQCVLYQILRSGCEDHLDTIRFTASYSICNSVYTIAMITMKQSGIQNAQTCYPIIYLQIHINLGGHISINMGIQTMSLCSPVNVHITIITTIIILFTKCK